MNAGRWAARALKHELKVSRTKFVTPVAQVLIEVGSVTEHTIHAGNARNIPTRDVLVET